MTVEPIEGAEPAAQAQNGESDQAAEETAAPQAEAPAAAGQDDASAPSVDASAPSEDTAEASVAAAPAGDPDAGAGEANSLGAGDSLAARAEAAVSTPDADGQSTDPQPEAQVAAPSGGPTDGRGAAEPAVAEPAVAEPVTDGQEATAEAGVDEHADAPPAVDDRPEPTTMEELLSEQSDEIRSLKHGDVVEGQVVRIDKDEILVDIGAKSEGVVSNRELYGRNAESQPQLDIGDTVLVYVLQPESNEGHAVLSLRRAGLERKWRSMQEQLDAGAIIEAPVIDHNKGGLIVDCGIRGFVPISQIVDFPRRPQNEQPRDAAQEIAEKLQPYVGRKLRLKILEVNRKANRLILSEKVALYEERREKRDELFSSLKVNQKVTGTVRSIAPFGVFVDLGGIDGLVHKSELSWNKVNNPEAGYKVGEEVEAEVIDINHERGRISLSIRRLQPDPWHSTVADLKVGDVIDGTVTKIVNFGAFVRVRDGLEGLIHISELSHQRVGHPGDVVHEGQKLKLKVISLDSERHRLGLSLKQAEEAPPRPPAAEPRERRARPERAYDPAQAVQEPDEGIDNTLAAAFAQVRQQVAESEAAAGDDAPAESTGTASAADAEPTAADAEPTAADATPPAAEAEAGDAVEAAPDTAEAPATTDEVAPAIEVGEGEGAASASPPTDPAQDAATPPDAPDAPDAPAAAEPPTAEDPSVAAEAKALVAEADNEAPTDQQGPAQAEPDTASQDEADTAITPTTEDQAPAPETVSRDGDA